MDSRRFHAVFTRSVSGDVVNAFLGTRRRTPSPAIDNARIPVAAHAMQSYYNFDVEGDAAKIISGSLFRPRHSPTPVNAGICEPFIPCIEPERY